MLPILVFVDLGIIAMKGFCTFPIARDGLVTYLRHTSSGSYPYAEMQSTYTTGPIILYITKWNSGERVTTDQWFKFLAVALVKRVKLLQFGNLKVMIIGKAEFSFWLFLLFPVVQIILEVFNCLSLQWFVIFQVATRELKIYLGLINWFYLQVKPFGVILCQEVQE